MSTYSIVRKISKILKEAVMPHSTRIIHPTLIDRLIYLHFAFIRNKKKSVYIASPPSGGGTLCHTVFNYYLNRKYRNKVLDNNDNFKRFDSNVSTKTKKWRRLSELSSEITTNFLLIGNYEPEQIRMFGLEKISNFIILTRNIPTAVYSWARAICQLQKGALLEVNDKINDNVIKRIIIEKGCLNRLIRFYNSWGGFLSKNQVDYDIIKFEDLKRDGLLYFEKLLKLIIKRDIDPDILREAIANADLSKALRQNKEKQAGNSKITNVTGYKGSISYKHEMGAGLYNFIEKEIDNKLTNKIVYPY